MIIRHYLQIPKTISDPGRTNKVPVGQINFSRSLGWVSSPMAQPVVELVSIKIHYDQKTLQLKSVIFYTELDVPKNFLCIPNSLYHNFVGSDYYL